MRCRLFLLAVTVFLSAAPAVKADPPSGTAPGTEPSIGIPPGPPGQSQPPMSEDGGPRFGNGGGPGGGQFGGGQFGGGGQGGGMRERLKQKFDADGDGVLSDQEKGKLQEWLQKRAAEGGGPPGGFGGPGGQGGPGGGFSGQGGGGFRGGGGPGQGGGGFRGGGGPGGQGGPGGFGGQGGPGGFGGQGGPGGFGGAGGGNGVVNWNGGGGGGGQRGPMYQRMMQKFDANGDGVLDDAEKAKLEQFREQRRKQRMQGGGPGGPQ